MSIVWVIALGACTAVFFAVYLVFSFTNYRKRFSEKYDLKNHFPYEFNFSSHFSDNILGNTALIFQTAISISFYAIALAYSNKDGVIYAVIASGILYALLNCAVNFVPLKTIRFHLSVSIILFVCSFFLPASIGLAFFRHYQLEADTLSLVMSIVSVVVALFNFVLVMNPKLSLSIKMNIGIDEKGQEYYVRPKYIMMAFTEWLMILSFLVDNVLFILLINLIK